MDEHSELAPCPFCGGKNLNYESRNAVECNDCTGSVCLELSYDVTAADAHCAVVKAWNRRPDPLEFEAYRAREAAQTEAEGGSPCEGCGKPGVVIDVNGCDLCQDCADGCRTEDLEAVNGRLA